MLTGDAYYAACDDDVWEWICDQVAHRRKSVPEEIRNRTASWDQVLAMILPVGAISRKKQYDDLREHRCSLDGSFLADLDHNAGFGPQSGPLFPALDTHPSVYSYKKQRLAVPMEYFQAQGLDAVPCLAGERGLSPLCPLLKKLARFLAGNAIHVPTMLCWMLFVFSHCRRRSELSRLCRAPSAAEASESKDGDAVVPAKRIRVRQKSADIFKFP